jgi:regulator of RNase E activity RraA
MMEMALTDEVREKLKQASTATLATVLFKRGFKNVFMMGPKRLNDDVSEVMVGEAFTLRYVPAREDLNGPGEFTDRGHPQRRAVEECPEGAVVVADCRGDVRAGTGGDILLTRMEVRGCAGMVSDGAMRDVKGIAPLRMPVYSSAVSAPASFTHHAAVDMQVPVACGGVPVYPGDVVVGDRDGVVVIPGELAVEVAGEAVAQEQFEAWVLDEVRGGRPTIGLYPPDDETRARYEGSRTAGL